MKVEQGGTKMYCPHCKSVQVCGAVSLSSLGEQAGQRWHMTGHADIQFFKRGRQCARCSRTFTTAEVAQSLIDELVELRDALADVKEKAEEYLKDSKRASSALQTLSKSLKAFRALDLYKGANSN